MRRYETIFILDPDLSEEVRKQILDRTTGLIEEAGGYIAKIDEWGNRKLAYAIAKKPRGHYFRLDYLAQGELIFELERTFRLDDRVFKYLTVLLDKFTSVEAVKAELEAAEKAAEEAAAKAEAEAAAAAAGEEASDETETGESEEE